MLNTTTPQAATWAQALTPEQLAQISLELGEVPNYARLAARKAAQRQTQWATFFRHPMAWLTKLTGTSTSTATSRMQAERGPQSRMTAVTSSNTSKAA